MFGKKKQKKLLIFAIMIVEREKEIELFIPETYYTVKLNVVGITFESRRFETEEDAIRIMRKSDKTIASNL